MKDVSDLHQIAMEIADRAQEARRGGDLVTWKNLTEEALSYESRAAFAISASYDLEPTRSILLRSAATLAVEAKDLKLAEKLIATALAGSPPHEIADELRDLLEDVYFHRHLELRGITLSPGELQMSIEGASVGFGMAPSEAFVQRVTDFETLLYRTAERLLEKPFREAGRRVKKLSDSLQLFISVPRAASFAVTLRLGKSDQLEFKDFDLSSKAMDDVMSGLELVNSQNFDALHDQIPQDDYYRNFVALARKLAPDGKDVRTVGFTAVGKEINRTVALDHPKIKIVTPVVTVENTPLTDGLSVEIRGQLLEADAKGKSEGLIEVIDFDGKPHQITVPRGMMSDIVKPMFEEQVFVNGIYKNNGTVIELQSIDLLQNLEEGDQTSDNPASV